MADFPISGSIDPQTFPFLLTDLHRNGATGSLKVEGPTYQKALYFRGGRVLFGSSNDPRDQLGAILIENGRITPEQLEDVNAKVGPGRPLAKVLSESGLVSQQELSEAAQIKVERILWDIVTYTAGSFEFEDGVLPKGAVDLKLSTERLILASIRRVTDRSFVLRHLGSLEVVLRPTAELHARLHEVQADAGGLAEQIDGTRTLREAAAATRLDEFDAAKAACGLLILGLVEKTGEVPADASSDEAAPFIIPDQGDGDASGIDLGETARESMVASEETASPDAPFFVPDGFDAPPPALHVEPEPEPEPEYAPTLNDTPAPVFESAPPMFEPAPPPMARPASSPGMLPLIPPPPRKPDPPQWTPPPEPEPEPLVEEEPPVAPVPASKEDLAALDRLLNPRSVPEPVAAQDDRGDTWEPQFSPALTGGARRQVEGGRDMKALALWGLLAFILVGGAGAGYYVFVMQAQEPPVVAATTPAPVATPGAARTTVPVAATPGGQATSAAAAGTSSPAPTAVRTTAPTKEPATQPPTAAPTKAAATAATAGAGEARSLLRSGQFSSAANAFASQFRRANGFTVQLLVACSEETVKKAVTSAGQDELYIVPVDHKGRSCYKIGWGLYDSEVRAASAMKSLPDYFRQPGVTPRVVSTATVLR